MSDAPLVPPVRSQVFVSFYDPTNAIVKTIGTVLAINTLDQSGIAENGAPSLTVLVVNPTGTDSKLGGIKWSEEFTRLTGVKHYTHDAHDTGLTQAAWLELPADAWEDSPDILPDRNPTPSNPIFERQLDKDVTSVSLGQAAAVQSGKVPAGSGTPLLHSSASGEDTSAELRTKEEHEAATKGPVEATKPAEPVIPAEPGPTGPAPVIEPTAEAFSEDNAAGQATGNAEEHAQEVATEERQD